MLRLVAEPENFIYANKDKIENSSELLEWIIYHPNENTKEKETKSEQHKD